MKKTILLTCSLAIAVMAYAQTDEQKAQQQEAMEAVKQMMKDGNMGSLPGMNTVELNEKYTFQHSVDMKVTVYNSKEAVDHNMDYTMFLGKEANNFGMEAKTEMGNMTMVYEMEKRRMVMMSESGPVGKMGMVSSIPEAKDDAQSNEDLNLKKTGNTKTLLGKKCEEWAGEDDGHEYSLWMAVDAPFSFAKAYQEMARAQNKGKGGNTEYPDGMLMEMTSMDTKNKTKTHVVVTAINENINKTISTEGWSFMQMGG